MTCPAGEPCLWEGVTGGVCELIRNAVDLGATCSRQRKRPTGKGLVGQKLSHL